jgi:hypothetical protein
MDDMWPRLGRLWLRALLPGVGLALLLFGLLVAMPVWLAFPVIAQGPVFGAALVVAAVVLTLFAHSLFVTLLTDHLVTGQWRPRWRALGAALLMTIPFALFSWLDMAGSSYGCADGQVIDRNMIPMWPWAWIGS